MQYLESPHNFFTIACCFFSFDEQPHPHTSSGSDDAGNGEGLGTRSPAVADIISEFLLNGFPTSALERMSWCEAPLAPVTPLSPPTPANAHGEETFFQLITYDTEPTSSPLAHPSRRPLLGRCTTAMDVCRDKDGREEDGEEGGHGHLSSHMSCHVHNGDHQGVGPKGSLDRMTSGYKLKKKSKTLFSRASDDSSVVKGGAQTSTISSPLNSVYLSGSQTWKRKTGIRRKRKISCVVPVIPEVSYTLEVGGRGLQGVWSVGE